MIATVPYHRTRVKISRRGYTLVELVTGVAATSILVAGMGSVVMVAARSTNESTLPARQIQASRAVHDILAELQFAVSFNERTATAVEFTVTDRDANAVAETIRYAWSGTAGDPLTRKYNGGTAVDYLDNVQAFNYSDLVETVTDYDGTETHHVYQCDVTLQAGDSAAARIAAVAKTLNAPEVASP
jgi:Tfp pilus assembly protein FimT